MRPPTTHWLALADTGQHPNCGLGGLQAAPALGLRCADRSAARHWPAGLHGHRSPGIANVSPAPARRLSGSPEPTRPLPIGASPSRREQPYLARAISWWGVSQIRCPAPAAARQPANGQPAASQQPRPLPQVVLRGVGKPRSLPSPPLCNTNTRRGPAYTYAGRLGWQLTRDSTAPAAWFQAPVYDLMPARQSPPARPIAVRRGGAMLSLARPDLRLPTMCFTPTCRPAKKPRLGDLTLHRRRCTRAANTLVWDDSRPTSPVPAPPRRLLCAGQSTLARPQLTPSHR